MWIPNPYVIIISWELITYDFPGATLIRKKIPSHSNTVHNSLLPSHKYVLLVRWSVFQYRKSIWRWRLLPPLLWVRRWSRWWTGSRTSSAVWGATTPLTSLRWQLSAAKAAASPASSKPSWAATSSHAAVTSARAAPSFSNSSKSTPLRTSSASSSTCLAASSTISPKFAPKFRFTFNSNWIRIWFFWNVSLKYHCLIFVCVCVFFSFLE